MAEPTRLPVSVAAGSSAATAVGAATLRQGGSAADAAAAMALAACVAETVFTGLTGGGFATYFEAASGTTSCLDFFVTVPGLEGQRPHQPEQVPVDFGGQLLLYAVGPATVAVPGVPAGLAEVHARWGRLDWSDVVQPSVELADRGVVFGAQQAKLLQRVAHVMLLGAGGRVYAPHGVPLGAAGHLHHPGLAHALEMFRDEGAAAFYSGPIAEALVAAVSSAGMSAADLSAYRVLETAPRSAPIGRCTVQARGTDLDDLLGVVSALDVDGDETSTVRSLVDALRTHPRRGDTTSAAAADADGNACAITTSLGLSSGVWLEDYGLHLNSMLGEGELLRGDLAPGGRMGSMMTPLVMLDEAGRLSLVAGAAGGSRIRSALAQVLLRVVRDGMTVADAIRAPRLNPVPGKVHVEPGFPDAVLTALEADGTVVRWPELDPYFGGVAAIDRHGPGADPRRDGDTSVVTAGVS